MTFFTSLTTLSPHTFPFFAFFAAGAPGFCTVRRILRLGQLRGESHHWGGSDEWSLWKADFQPLWSSRLQLVYYWQLKLLFSELAASVLSHAKMRDNIYLLALRCSFAYKAFDWLRLQSIILHL